MRLLAGHRTRWHVTYSAVGPVAVTIFVRVALGSLLERFGPVNVQSCLLFLVPSGWRSRP